jgi:hypothetical protein
MYRQPSLIQQICANWKANPPGHEQQNTPNTIPHGWQRNPNIAKNFIKAFPFCDSIDSNGYRRCGNLEHMHLFCPSPILVNTRTHCLQKIETALFNIYNYASIREYDVSVQNAPNRSSLQDDMEKAALDTELRERPIVCNNKVILEARDTNLAILSRSTIMREIFIGKLPEAKMQEFNLYPFAHRLGLIHSIPEDKFNVESATITEMGFIGLFPKAILDVLHHYTRDIRKTSSVKECNSFIKLIEHLLTAFIYRPVVMQKVIQLMLCKQKKQIEQPKELDTNTSTSEEADKRPEITSTRDSSALNDVLSREGQQQVIQPNNTSRNICYASKCRILQAAGIIRRPMFCMPGKQTCAGCNNEMM